MKGSVNCRVDIIGVQDMPEVRHGDPLADIIIRATNAQATPITQRDVIVVTQKIVSKSEGRLYPLDDVAPSTFARSFAERSGKDPRLVELILMESSRIVRSDADRGILIVETEHGFVCANAGIDSSNVETGMVSLLPKDPDRSARRIRETLQQKSGVSEIAVVISDTFGRAWREGQINVAIGAAGMDPFIDYRGSYDTNGSVLTSTRIAVADELAAAAELVMGKSDRIPTALVKGFSYTIGRGNCKSLVRDLSKDLFR